MFIPLDLDIALVECTMNPTIQEQHAGLFNSWCEFATIYNVQQGKLTPAQCVSFLYALRDYARIHFECEENWQKDYCWEKCEDHAKLHASFITCVATMPDQLWASNFNPSKIRELLMYIRTWLLQHTSTEDAEFYLEVARQ